jgi:hypothetical protein
LGIFVTLASRKLNLAEEYPTEMATRSLLLKLKIKTLGLVYTRRNGQLAKNGQPAKNTNQSK